MPTSAVIKIDLQIEGGQRLSLSVANLKELKEAIKQINQTKITLDPRSPQFAQASNQLKTLTTLYKGLAKDADSAETQIKEANRALNEQPKALGYYRQLQAQLVALKNQFKDLSQTEAQGRIGQNLARQIDGISTKLKGLDANLGDFQRNVGNYGNSLRGIGDVFTGGLVTGGAVAAVALLADTMATGAKQAIAYEKALDNLSALTGLEGAGLDNLDRIARGLQNIDLNGIEIVKTGPEILNALKLVGGARPELLGDAEALGEVTKAAIVLSQASGDELAPSVEALTTTLGQFKLPASEAEKLINELAAGAKEGSAEIPQITSALREFGTVAEISNVKTSESIALIELLADRQLKGAEAGTQLRNILSKLASADILPKNAQKQFERLGIDINVLKDATLPLEVRLRELGKAQGDLSALTKVFGLENLQAATIITSGLPKYLELNKAIQGTNEAYRQAAVNADNASTKFDNLGKNSLNALAERFSGLTGVANGFLDVLNFMVTRLDAVGVAFDLATGPLVKFSNAFDKSDALQKLAKEGKLGRQKPVDPDAFKLEDEFFPRFSPSFDELVDNTDELLAKAKDITDATDKDTAAKTKNAKANESAADSVSRLRQQVSLLQQQLSDAPQSKVFDATVKLVSAEKQLAEAEIKLAEARKRAISAGVGPFDQAAFLGRIGASEEVLGDTEQAATDLAVKIDTDANKKKAKEDLQKLANDLAGSVGVVLPVEVDQDDARRAFESQKYFLEQENKAREKAAAEETKRKEKQQQQQQEFFQVGLEAANNFNQQLSAQEAARVESNLQRQTEAINAEFEQKREAAQGNAVILANLEKQQRERQLAAEKQAARERKAIARKEAAINYALALIASGGNPIKLLSATAAFVLGLAAINAQEFYAGGTVKGMENEQGVVKKPNMKRTRHGDNRVAFLRVGERVLTRDNQAELERQYGSGVWKTVGAKDPNSIFGNRHPGMAIPKLGYGRQILNVSTSLSRQDIDQLSGAIAQTNERMGSVVKSAMIEGARYAAREQKALSKTR